MYVPGLRSGCMYLELIDEINFFHCGQPWRHFSDEDSYNVVISGGFDCVLSDKGVNRDFASTPCEWSFSFWA